MPTNISYVCIYKIAQRSSSDDDRMTRVAIYTPDLLAGGAQSVTTTLANGLSKREFSVDLVMPCPMGRHIQELDDGVNTVFLQEKKLPVIGSASCLIKYRTYILDTDPDIVVSQRTHGNVVSLIACHSLQDPPPVAVTEHGHHVADGIKDKITLNLSKATYNLATEIICVSDSIANDVRSSIDLEDDKLSVIPNPFDIDSIQSRALQSVTHEWLNDKNEDVVLSAGRLEPVKNFELLIDSFEKIYQENPSTKLIILGEGNERERLTATIESRCLSNVVDLPGYVDNPYKYIKKADVFALSSRREALPSVLIEALAVGCPVVATDCGGAREILNDGKYGLLVEPNEQGLYEGIVAALSKTPNRSMMKKRAEHYNTSNILDEYSTLIENIIENHESKTGRIASRS